MGIYVFFRRKKEQGIFLPNFEISDTKPEVAQHEEKRVHFLEDGECIYGGKFYFSQDLNYMECFHYRISNVDGKAKEEMIEHYTLPRYGT